MARVFNSGHLLHEDPGCTSSLRARALSRRPRATSRMASPLFAAPPVPFGKRSAILATITADQFGACETKVSSGAFLIRLRRWETVPSAGPHRLPYWWTDDASASSRASLPAFGPPPSARASASRSAAERAEAS